MLNETEWESSICSCFWWHKNLKCSHTISLACRMKLANFDQVAYSIPLNKKRKAGRQPKPKTILAVIDNVNTTQLDNNSTELENRYPKRTRNQ